MRAPRNRSLLALSLPLLASCAHPAPQACIIVVADKANEDMVRAAIPDESYTVVVDPKQVEKAQTLSDALTALSPPPEVWFRFSMMERHEARILRDYKKPTEPWYTPCRKKERRRK